MYIKLILPKFDDYMTDLDICLNQNQDLNVLELVVVLTGWCI